MYVLFSLVKPDRGIPDLLHSRILDGTLAIGRTALSGYVDGNAVYLAIRLNEKTIRSND